MQHMTKPVAIFWGEAEKVCSRAMFDATTAALPDAAVFTYPGAGHAPFWERPDAFDTDLASFADTAFTRIAPLQAAQGAIA